MKHIYNKKTAEYIDTALIDDEMSIYKHYPNAILSDIKYIVPQIIGNNLIETFNIKMTVIYEPITKKVIEIKNGYYKSENSKVFDYDSEVIQNQRYYYLNENLELVLDEALKNKDIELEEQKRKELEKAREKEIEEELKEKNKVNILETKVADLTAMLLEFMGGEEDETKNV